MAQLSVGDRKKTRGFLTLFSPHSQTYLQCEQVTSLPTAAKGWGKPATEVHPITQENGSCQSS